MTTVTDVFVIVLALLTMNFRLKLGNTFNTIASAMVAVTTTTTPIAIATVSGNGDGARKQRQRYRQNKRDERERAGVRACARFVRPSVPID